MSTRILAGCLAALMIAACGAPEPSSDAGPVSPGPQPSAAAQSPDSAERCAQYAEQRMPLFGDVHVHTSFSFDAAANSTGATPQDAHRFARGEPIPFWPIGEDGKPEGEARIDKPLDFLAVTDHGEFLGERALCRTEGSPVYASDFCTQYRSNERVGMRMLGTVVTSESPARIAQVCGADGAWCAEYARGPWQAIQDAANQANTPCEFTSFVAYEYTGTPGTSNYHRNVIFRGEPVPDLPVSYVDAPYDSQLWAQLDAACPEGSDCDYLTIPHNTNLANGRMAPYMRLPDTVEARRQYAQTRLKREPVMEIFQHKGGSECINGLSSILGAPDELCDVEAVRRMGENKAYAATDPDNPPAVIEQHEVTRECAPGEIGSNGMLGAGCVDPTDFQRSGLVVGLKEERATGFNPIKLGVIAATDTHAATPGAVSESTWTGAVTGESNPAERLQPGLLTSGIDGNPGGLAGVWARENTRDAIFDAMLAREVFGTSGPRIVPRLFAGAGLSTDLCADPDMVPKAYAAGVPMGGDLPSGPAPRFLVYAMQDPASQPLQALHLVKGWVDDSGAMHTRVDIVAEAPDGAGSLCAVYTDPDFDPAQSAYYYLRVVEPATPRWHTYDCARLEASGTPAEDLPPVCHDGSYPDTVQEMAWTSPIWYRGG